jgi:Transposase IS116/IS110/IS902 family
MVAEIGYVSRFPDAQHMCSWAGLTPIHRESDTKVHRGAPWDDDEPIPNRSIGRRPNARQDRNR